ncbi:MAG TPA: hypothetical protein PLC15_17425 [Candidatus Obscuribacter sp.]|nr:hypothetical protein [Candidatus Obscuribacter sp.]HNB17168.1 hypothetical protein [Candidatus Obscuribacter sp.]HNG17646.1 hypothetical protein [Candidatus Obscuribacter sp.]HNN63413.1 hypothetical protein [Candidatus Obscuribacter sp.]
MKERFNILALASFFTFVCGNPAVASSPKTVETGAGTRLQTNKPKIPVSPESATEPKFVPEVKPLTADELEKLLKTRLDGRLSFLFRQFANMFVVKSTIELGKTVALATSSNLIEYAELESVFPVSYKPRLQELLDAIALQTGAKWVYDPTGNFIRSNSRLKKPISDIVVFEFSKVERKKPIQVTLAKGWTATDRGHWIMCVPPTAPVGMDIYELGRYSCDDKVKTQELFMQIPKDVALDWARRVKPDASASELKAAKVGKYDALLFEATVKAKAGGDVHWRHWVFMAGDRCFLVLSTLFPDQEQALLSDVEAMIKSIQVTESEGGDDSKVNNIP